MKSFDLILDHSILNKIEEVDIDLIDYTILTLYVFKNIYGTSILVKLIEERNGLNEKRNWSNLCRNGYLEKIDTSVQGDVNNYKLTPKGELF